jgi:ribosomal protein L19
MDKPTYSPSISRVHLKTYEDVRRLLSITISDLRQLKIDPTVARAIIYGCQIMLTVFEGILLEKDIKELQELANQRYGYGGKL